MSKGDLLAYVREDEVKLIRRKHRIGFSTTNTVEDLVRKLEKVPRHATVDDVELHDDSITTILFHEESVSKGGD